MPVTRKRMSFSKSAPVIYVRIILTFFVTVTLYTSDINQLSSRILQKSTLQKKYVKSYITYINEKTHLAPDEYFVFRHSLKINKQQG